MKSHFFHLMPYNHLPMLEQREAFVEALTGFLL